MLQSAFVVVRSHCRYSNCIIQKLHSVELFWFWTYLVCFCCDFIIILPIFSCNVSSFRWRMNELYIFSNVLFSFVLEKKIWCDKRSFIRFYFHINSVIGWKLCRMSENRNKQVWGRKSQKRSVCIRVREKKAEEAVEWKSIHCILSLHWNIKMQRRKSCKQKQMYHTEYWTAGWNATFQRLRAISTWCIFGWNLTFIFSACSRSLFIHSFGFYVHHYRSGGYAYLFRPNIKQNKSTPEWLS